MDEEKDVWNSLSKVQKQILAADKIYENQEHPKCHHFKRFNCSLFNCSIHQKLSGNYALQKKRPTKFGRSLPICWIIAASQFLADIDWPAVFQKFCYQNPNHSISVFLDLILKAKLEHTERIFNAAPAACLFIQKFKPNWSMDVQQDSIEFIQSFLVNINKLARDTPKAFFNAKPNKQELSIIQFVQEKLSICTMNKITCRQCKKWWFGGNDEIIKQNMLLLPFPSVQINQQILHGQSIQSLLHHFTKPQSPGPEHKCEFCYKKGMTRKQIIFTSAPKYLLIAIKRMQYTTANNSENSGKINSCVRLNDKINIVINDKAIQYQLSSTLDHEGISMHAGHYVSIKRIQDKLFHCNDAKHHEVDAFNPRTVYCCLYVRKTKAKSSLRSARRTGKRNSNEANLYLETQPSNRRQKLNASSSRQSSFADGKVNGENVTDANNKKTRKRSLSFKDENPAKRFKGLSNNVTQSNSKTWKCCKCNKEFKHKSSLKRHFQKHLKLNANPTKKLKLNNKSKRHCCPHCDRDFKSQNGLNSHIGKIHQEHVVKKCPKCGKSFSATTRLSLHLKQAHSSSNQSFKCQQCSEEYENLHGLVTHVGMTHQEEKFNPNFDFTQAIHFPSWKAIKEHRTKNSDYMAAGCLKMIGRNLADPRQEPSDVSFNVNKQEIIKEWRQNMDHNAPIGVCGTCGCVIIKVDDEFDVMSINNKVFQMFKADKQRLPPKDSVKYESLHLKEFQNGDIFKMCEKGIIDCDKVLICKLCSGTLKYAVKRRKLPIHTIAHYDLGKKPTGLVRLSLGEKISDFEKHCLCTIDTI